MRQLKADDQIIRVAKTARVRLDQGLAQLCQAGLVGFIDDELIGIGASIRPHGHRFPAEDELRAALAESLPTPKHLWSHAPCCGPIPAFHRLNGVAIADLLAIDLDMIE